MTMKKPILLFLNLSRLLLNALTVPVLTGKLFYQLTTLSQKKKCLVSEAGFNKLH